MLQHTNIDRLDSQINTNAPFTFDSTMDIAGSVVPSGYFIALKLYLREGYQLPLHGLSISETSEGFEFNFGYASTITAIWKYKQPAEKTAIISTLLQDAYGRIAGSIMCTSELPELIINIIKRTGDVQLSGNAFVVLPQCMEAVHSPGLESIVVNNIPYTNGFSFSTSGYGVLSVDETKCISISSVGVFKNPGMIYGIDRLVVKQYDIPDRVFNVRGRHLYIKPALESNLRVITDSGKITIQGVLNAE